MKIILVDKIVRCEGRIVDWTLRRKRERESKSYRCSQRARYDIDGAHLCGLHAGRYALERGLEESK
jgi:hypothetical protein